MKITKETLKKLILEEIGGMPQKTGDGNIYPGYGYTKNFPSGEAPDNRTYDPYKGREPYETGPIVTQIKDGEMYVTQGKNKFHLIFDNPELTSGRVIPMGELKFTIDNGAINWFEEAPANVRFDANLENQILDFSGREK
jgi:hypothetical protein